MKPINTRLRMFKYSTQKNFRSIAYKTEVSIQKERYDQELNKTHSNFKKPSVVKEKRHREFLVRKKKLLGDIAKGFT